jgi:hypothetical protein
VNSEQKSSVSELCVVMIKTWNERRQKYFFELFSDIEKLMKLKLPSFRASTINVSNNVRLSSSQ